MGKNGFVRYPYFCWMRIFKHVILALPAFLSLNAAAQYTDSTAYHINAVASGSVNITKELSNYLLNNALNFGIRKQAVSLNCANTWVYGSQNRNITNNDYTGTFNCNLYQGTGKFYYWALANYTTSLSLKVRGQYQVGAGAAYSFVDDKEYYFNISEGIIFEQSDIMKDDTTREVYSTFRNSLRLLFKYTFAHVVSISGTGYLQNSLQYAGDHIAKVNLAASLKLKKWLSFTAAMQYNKVSRTDRENFLFTYGITIDKYY